MSSDLNSMRDDFALFAGEGAPVYRLDSCEAIPQIGAACIAIGAFDGFHIGHRELVHQAVEDARAQGVAAVAVTFDPDPDEVVGRPAPKLSSVYERLVRLAHAGLDAVLVVPFTHELSAMDHETFFQSVLTPAVDIRSIHVGRDFRLGYRGASDVSVISAWGAERDIRVVGHELVSDDGTAISATRIRGELSCGDVEAAARHLGRRPIVRGTVVSGRGEGSGMGIPTANVEFSAALQVPAEGVYSGLALVEGVAYPAAINVGVPPTFADSSSSAHMEANLIGFAGDIYGSPIALSFSRFLRPTMKFPSIEVLVDTVNGNIADVIGEFGQEGVALA